MGTLVALGARPAPLAVASGSALVALGVWSIVSTLWGGLPHQAWRFLDHALIAAAAVVLGSLLAAAGRRAVVATGILVGIGAVAAALLYWPLVGAAPLEWYDGRSLSAWFGYRNACGGFLAIGLGPALWGLRRRGAVERFASGAAATTITAAVLLSQSRAALAVAALSVAVVLG
ncbi:MAG: hypothetical protein M3364_02900, partial [Actinomycetota bacterium]|nr:hypothetical protein [Actinomycetota bacterium]